MRSAGSHGPFTQVHTERRLEVEHTFCFVFTLLSFAAKKGGARLLFEQQSHEALQMSKKSNKFKIKMSIQHKTTDLFKPDIGYFKFIAQYYIY